MDSNKNVKITEDNQSNTKVSKSANTKANKKAGGLSENFFDYDKYLQLESLENNAEQSEAKNAKGNSKNKKKKKKNTDIVNIMDRNTVNKSIKRALDNTVEDDVSDFVDVNMLPPADITVKKHGFKRKMYFTIGFIVSVMSLIGFIFTVNFTVDIIKNIADNTTQKQEFARFIYPVVIVDPPPFESANQLVSDTVVSAAIWDIILNEDTSKYPIEFEVMTVPELDVEHYATKMFGKGLSFQHRTLGDAQLAFYYSAETKSYSIPVTPKFFPYSPYVEKLKRDGDKYTLRVGYVSPSPAWLSPKESSEKPMPDKYMDYVIKKSDGQYTLITIKEPDEILTQDK